jgi:predicted DCC family thiol-disulfide oxidoreductase YuxK
MDTTTWLQTVEARAEERLCPEEERKPRALAVLFDPSCALCRRCRTWMLGQPSYIPLTFIPCSGDYARARFGDIPWLGDELIVVGDGGEVWVGPAAFLTCLWALIEWREWSFRMASPAFAPLAERFFHFISSRRSRIAAILDHDCAEGTCRVRRDSQKETGKLP